MRWLLQSALALDQAANAILLFGWADETVSARAWRLSNKGPWKIASIVIDAAFRLFGQRDHCFEAYVSERLRKQSPPEER